MAKVSKKQKTQFIILGILSAALVVVIYWQYLLSPIKTECEELQSTIEDNEMLQMSVMLEVASINSLIDDNEALMKSLETRTADLYPVMNTDDVDIILLKYIQDSGFEVSSLSIGAEESTENAEGNSATGISTINATYSIAGSYKQLLSLIEKINTEPAVIITAITASSEEESEQVFEISADGGQNTTVTKPASEDNLTLEISFCVFMYEAPEIPETFESEKNDSLLGDDEDEESPNYLL